jgi:hypothetical protein
MWRVDVAVALKFLVVVVLDLGGFLVIGAA